MKNRGFSLVELMVVVAIIAILTAIALPFYVHFRRRAVVQGAIAPCNDSRKAVQAHFQTHQSLDNFGFVVGNFGQISAFSPEMNTTTPVGSSLPPVRGLSWDLDNQVVSEGRVERAIIGFNFDPAICLGCDGRFCILCDTTEGACVYEVNVDLLDDPANNLNSLDRNRNTACTLDSVAAVSAALQGP